MRAREFLLENSPPPSLKGVIEFEGLHLLVSIDGANADIRVLFDPDKIDDQIAYAALSRDGGKLYPEDLYVNKEHRSQGIARKMYDYLKSLGFRILRLPKGQLDAGRKFWEKHRGKLDDPDAKMVWEQSEVLFEYKRDITAQKLGDKLLAWLKERNPDMDYSEWTPERKQRTIDSLLQVIENTDPTENKQYVVWIINTMFREGTINPEAEIMLRLFELAKKNNILAPQDRDINQFKTVPELKEMLSQYPEEDITMGRARYKNVYNDDQISVDIPMNEAGSCKLGYNTKWCTSARKSENFFDSYNNEGPLWVITPKNPAHEYQRFLIHFPRGEFANELNRQIPILALMHKFPQLKQVLDRPENWAEMLKVGTWSRKSIGKDADLPTYLATDYPELVMNDENVSEYFKDIDPRVLENNQELIKGVVKHGVSLQDIPPNYRNKYEIVKAAVEGRAREIENVPIRMLLNYPELVDLALEQGWDNLRHLAPELMTEEIIREALLHSPYLINYIPVFNLTPKIILDVIDKYGPTEQGLLIIDHLKHDPEKFGVEFWRKLLEKNEDYKMLIPSKYMWDKLVKAGIVSGDY